VGKKRTRVKTNLKRRSLEKAIEERGGRTKAKKTKERVNEEKVSKTKGRNPILCTAREKLKAFFKIKFTRIGRVKKSG